jgi:hypothetical protein
VSQVLSKFLIRCVSSIHLLEEETDAQRGTVICVKSQEEQLPELGLDFMPAVTPLCLSLCHA